jgi:hypothetical protein
VFYRIFDILAEPKLDGPRFLCLANQLPRYDGAVRRRMEYEAQQNEETGARAQTEDSQFAPGQSMSMSEALARSKGDEVAVLNSLNRESKNSALGALFEYETG